MTGRAITSSWDGHYMAPAFYGCVGWALGNDELMAAFRTETGNNWSPGKNGLEIAIDKATGVDFEFMQAFSTWVEKNVFGTPADMDAEESGA